MAHAMSNLYALTPPESQYPPYISINETHDGLIRITVRSEAHDVVVGRATQRVCGDTAQIAITHSEFMELLHRSFAGMTKGQSPAS